MEPQKRARMHDNRVLITGGAGLVGSHIADLLIRRQVAEIIIVDNFSRGQDANIAHAVKRGNTRIIHGDIRDRTLLADAIQAVDVVFHQAAIRITQCAEEPRLALEVLAEGTFNVLEEAVKAGVKKVIAASSASVYGLADEFPTTESQHPYNNRTLYGAAKAFNEGLLRSFYEMYGLNYVALRYFNVYGPRMDIYGAYTEVLIRWMERIAAGVRPLIFGDGKQTMDFVYVDDVANANILAAESDVTDVVFNIASGVETSLLDLLSALLRVMDSSLQPEFVEQRKVNPVPRRLADTRKAAEVLGFQPAVSLEEGLSRLVHWWQETRQAS
jgi:UDP-glucose 4-epimerase